MMISDIDPVPYGGSYVPKKIRERRREAFGFHPAEIAKKASRETFSPKGETLRADARPYGKKSASLRNLRGLFAVAACIATAAGGISAYEALTHIQARTVTVPRQQNAAAQATADTIGNAFALWRDRAGKASDVKVPSYIDANFLWRMAGQESSEGVRTQKAGSSYVGVFQYSVAADTAAADIIGQTAQMLDGVRTQIPVLARYDKITPDILMQPAIFNDDAVQTFMAANETLHADHILTRDAKYRALPPEMKGFILYAHHNWPGMAQVILDNLGSPKSVAQLVPEADRARDQTDFNANSGLYGKDGINTPYQVEAAFRNGTDIFVGVAPAPPDAVAALIKGAAPKPVNG